MPELRFSGRRFRISALAAGTAAALAISLFSPPPSRAAADKQLQRIKGQVAFTRDATSPETAVAAKILLDDNADAITHAKSAATLTMPDSSIIGLGENTDVNVGLFENAAAGPGSTITVKNGTLRFDVRRPQGGTANYRFTTPTTQVAVRGTVGLLSFVGGNTTVACVVCAADSVVVNVGTQTFTLLSGQLLTVSITGAVVTGVVTTSVLGGFTAAGVSTSASTGAAAATAGVAGSTGAIAGTTAAVAGGAVAAGAAAAVISSQATAKPQESPSPTGTAAGSINLTGAVRPTASPSPPVARPLAPPAPAAPGGRR
jgi:hypothetical protein